VLFHDEPETSIVDFLYGWTFCRLQNFTLNDDGYEHLMRIVTDQERVVKKPLGKIPDLPPDPPPTTAVIENESSGMTRHEFPTLQLHR